jgi:uncharacterized protein (DUF2141 family)
MRSVFFASKNMTLTQVAWLEAGMLTLLLLCIAQPAIADASVTSNVIEFETQNRNDAGLVRCGLFTQSGWLKDALRASIVKVHGKRALCVFRDVPAGSYGISAFHDENNDGKLDTNLVGYPTEEYCASNNARNLLSAPSFRDARFEYRGGTARLRAMMK